MSALPTPRPEAPAHQPMPETAPNAELLRALRRLVRGLSALLLGLPLTLFVCIQSAVTEWLRPMGVLPPMFGMSLLLYGLVEMGHFQKQERVWQTALDRAKMLGVVNLGLSPFIYWWNRMPGELAFTVSIGLLTLSSLLFLFNLNCVLQRLAAMLPDETLRADTNFFTTLNLGLVLALLTLAATYFVLAQIDTLPQLLIVFTERLYELRRTLMVFLVILPVAMTMTLIWKIKEVVLTSVFDK
jgi:hypothetical protein